MTTLPGVPARIVAILFALALCACKHDQIAPPIDERPATLPTYAQLAAHYNANLAGLDRLWAHAKVELTWYEKDKRRYEEGEGHLITIPPDCTALDVGKLGNTLLWMGGDASRMWLFDLQGDGTAYVGRRSSVGKPCANPLPAPVLPLHVPRLLGIMSLDERAAGIVRWEPVGKPNGGSWTGPESTYSVLPPGTLTKLWLDRDTALPVRIDLFNTKGQVAVTAWLWESVPVDVSPARPKPPRINRQITVTVAGERGRMKLTLDDPTDGRDENKIKDRVFDYDTLKKLLKPDKEVVLDARCP